MTANMLYKVIQGHQFRYQWKATTRLRMCNSAAVDKCSELVNLAVLIEHQRLCIFGLYVAIQMLLLLLLLTFISATQ